jgi:hypothetical protein
VTPSAEEVKRALRRRYPGETRGGMVGQWVYIEEWLNIDFLALNAWAKADVVGHEIKVSRADYRRELLRPYKRQDAIKRTTSFYFVVPKGLLTAEELALPRTRVGTGGFRPDTVPWHRRAGRWLGLSARWS